MALMDLPFPVFYIYQVYTVNRLIYRFYHCTIFTNLAPASGLRRKLANRPTNLPVFHFVIFTYLSAHAGI